MSDATRGTGDDGRPRFRRSWFEHAGEVTKKGKPADEANAPPAEEPPRPTGPKIGGARDFRSTRPLLAVANNKTGVADGDLLTTGGVQAYVLMVGAETDSKRSRLLDAQSGWRHYWSNVTIRQMYEWTGLPEVKVSDSCYECHDTVESCYRPQPVTSSLFNGSQLSDGAAKCDSCARHKSQCLFLVSYRYHPDEDCDIWRVSDYSMREHARNWQAAQKASLTVATRTTISTPLHPRRPRAPNNDIEKSKPTAESQRIPLAQQRATYEGLAEMYTKDSYHEDTGKNLRSMPYWADRASVRAPADLDRRPPSPSIDPPTLVKSPGLGGSSKADADIPEEFERKRSPWQHGRVERWADAQHTTSLYARSSIFQCTSLTRSRLTFAAFGTFHESLIAVCNEPPIWPASLSVPEGLILFSAATGSSLKCDFKWLPCRAPNEHICGFYLLEETGPELYHVLRADETGPATEQLMLTATPAIAAPRYLMHARTKKTFAFRPEGLSVMQALRQRAKQIQVRG
jgi:hypothetical protein